MTPLCELCVKYGTDKGPRSMNGWDYSPTYHQVLSPNKDKVKKVLEVGICGYRDIPNNVVGASLFVWRDYFPNAEIYGIDNDGRFIFNDQDRIHTAQADAYSWPSLEAALKQMGLERGSIDFIVDDAVHDPFPQVQLMHMLWPYLKKNGLYAMEDVCPPKLIGGMSRFIDLFQYNTGVQVVSTYKDEKLLLIHP